MTSVLSAVFPTVVSRRRALTAVAGVAALGLAGSARAVAAQESAGSGPVGVRTAQDAAGPVVVATGSGSASTPADRVLIQLIARSADSYGGGKGDAPMEAPDAPDAATPAAGPTEEALRAAVDVLTEAGVDEGSILVVAPEGSVASSFFGFGAGMVGAELTGDQLDLLPGLLSDASTALTEQGLLVDQPMAIFLADGCVDLRAEALAAAVKSARADADALAKALGVETTTLHRATEFGYSYGPYAYVSGPSDACDALPELADLPRTYLSAYDPTAPLEFTVVASIELIMNVE